MHSIINTDYGKQTKSIAIIETTLGRPSIINNSIWETMWKTECHFGKDIKESERIFSQFTISVCLIITIWRYMFRCDHKRWVGPWRVQERNYTIRRGKKYAAFCELFNITQFFFLVDVTRPFALSYFLKDRYNPVGLFSLPFLN